MEVTVKTILQRPFMKNTKIIAGKQGINHQVDSASILEKINDEGGFLKNSIVITNELFLAVYKEEKYEDVIRAYKQKRVAALCIKFGSEEGETVPPALLKIAEKYQFPIIQLPQNAAISVIISGITYEVLNRSGYNLALPYEENFFQELIFSEIDRLSISKRAAMLGIKLDELIGLLLIQPKSERNIKKICSYCKEEWDSSCFAFSKNGRILILIRMNCVMEDMEKELKEKAQSLQKCLGNKFEKDVFYISAGRCYDDICDLHKSYYEARMALVVGKMGKNENRMYFFEQMGIYRILFDLKNKKDLYQFQKETIEELRRYDEHNHTCFLETIRAFFESSYSVPATAQMMYVHYNTIRYRMNKIKTIFGWDLTNKNDCINLVIALKIDDFLGEDKNF